MSKIQIIFIPPGKNSPWKIQKKIEHFWSKSGTFQLIKLNPNFSTPILPKSCWWFYDDDSFKMLVTKKLCKWNVQIFRFFNSIFQQHAWPYAPYIIFLIICQKFNSTQVSPAQKYRLESVLDVFLHVMHVHLSTFLSDSISF